MEYRISWKDEEFEEPCKCASCGESNIKITHSGILV
jgi:hypothetical protein